MKRSTQIVTATALTVAALGAGAGIARADVPPSPSDIPTATQPVVPTPTQFPAPNPFRGCRFTLTEEFTFAPQLGRFVVVTDPSITCVSRFRGVQVYTLQRGNGPSQLPRGEQLPAIG
jgi:hypothetical protein